MSVDEVDFAKCPYKDEFSKCLTNIKTDLATIKVETSYIKESVEELKGHLNAYYNDIDNLEKSLYNSKKKDAMTSTQLQWIKDIVIVLLVAIMGIKVGGIV